MQDFLTFKKMVTPVFIQVLFYIMVALSVIGGLVIMIMGIASSYGGGGMVFAGLLYIVLGPIFARIWCEILIVIFSINDTLREIRDGLVHKV